MGDGMGGGESSGSVMAEGLHAAVEQAGEFTGSTSVRLPTHLQEADAYMDECKELEAEGMSRAGQREVHGSEGMRDGEGGAEGALETPLRARGGFAESMEWEREERNETSDPSCFAPGVNDRGITLGAWAAR